MPFRYDLNVIQTPKIWISKITDDAKALQELFDREDSEGYVKKLQELKEKIPDKKVHDFRLTDGTIYEIFDEGVTMPVSIQFMVKGSVITWSFNFPKDETHQSWRDDVFNTAAIAHQSVELGCETYYRGSNAYHLKKMHSHGGEYDFNHNHYRLKEDHPITPREVEEHLRAFYNQAKGKIFIPDPAEIERIIFTYKVYWAEYDMDPRYSKYYPLGFPNDRVNLFTALLNATSQNEDYSKIINQFLDKLGVKAELLPKAIDNLTKALKETELLASHSGKNKLTFDLIERIINAARVLQEAQMPPEEIIKNIAFKFNLDAKVHGSLLIAFSEFFNKANFCKDFEYLKGISPPPDDIISESGPYVVYQNIAEDKNTSSKKQSSGSPRDQYISAMDQIMTLDDNIEFKLFAEALTNRCRSIDDAMLGELTPEKFRKALRLYNAMKCLTNGVVGEEQAKRFDPEIFKQVIQLKSEINGLVEVDEDPGPALEHIFKWIQKAPKELEEWIVWVEKNGSRGLGGELAHTREASGQRGRFFVPMDDRDDSIANVFGLKPKSSDPKDILIYDCRNYVQSIMHLMGERSFQDKSRVGALLIDILEGKENFSKLDKVLEENPRWAGPEQDEIKKSKSGNYIRSEVSPSQNIKSSSKSILEDTKHGLIDLVECVKDLINPKPHPKRQ